MNKKLNYTKNPKFSEEIALEKAKKNAPAIRARVTTILENLSKRES